jgi:PAS domain S-box-containing protein
VTSDSVSEGKSELIDQAVRTLIEDAKNAIFVLDREDRIQLVNKRAVTLTGKSKKDFMGKPFKETLGLTADKEIIVNELQEKETFLKGWIKASHGKIPADIRLSPVRMKRKLLGAVLILRPTQRPGLLHSLETLGSLIQRHSSAQKIYETLGEELGALGITLMVFPFEEDGFSIGYHTFDRKKTHITEFITGIPLSEIKFTMAKNAFKKVTEQKSLFSYDVSSLLQSATPQVTTSELRKFFSLVKLSRGVVVPVTIGDGLRAFAVFVSEEFTPEDAAGASALGVQVSAALERTDYFEKLVTDLKMLEEQISSRTRELEKVKSQMESIVQSSVDTIMAADMDGYVTFANKGVKTMLGYSPGEILGQNVTAYYAKGKKEAKRLRKVIMKKGQIENEALDFLTKDHQIVHTLASLSLLRDEKGEKTGIMAVLKDVTEQKRLQQTLESLNKAAARIQKSRTRKQIFSVTAEELKQLDFHVIFIMFNQQKTAGIVEYITEEGMLDSLEGRTLPEYQLPLNHSTYKKLIKKKEAVYIEDLQRAMKLLVPSDMHEISEKGIDLLGIASRRSILVPLVIHDETMGIFGVISHMITAGDIPSIRAFANQVSTALENARLLEESQHRADELARNLREQQLLREMNTNLFLAQSREEVLDAAIEGVHNLGRSFANISMLNDKKTHAKPVRLEMESTLLKMVEKAGKVIIPRFTLFDYEVPLLEEENIYYEFFNNQVPLISSNIEIHNYPVLKADMPELYAGFAARDSVMQNIIKVASRVLPYKSAMTFPIVVGGQTIGSFAVTSRKVFTEDDFVLMKTVGEMVSSAMERISHSERLNETLNELQAVQKITALLNMGAFLEQILALISSSIKEVYHYEFAFPLLLDQSRKYLTFEHMILPPLITERLHDNGIFLKGFKYPLSGDSPVLHQVLNQRKCLILKGLEELVESISVDAVRTKVLRFAPDLFEALKLQSHEINVMVAPLRYGEEVIGILILGHRKPLTEEDFQHLEYFLDQVGIAIAKSDVESKLRQSLKELQELDQMKSEFIDIASHELRTPLTTLKLYLEMMAMEQYGKLSEPLRERIRVMEEGVNRLEEIINQTLVASRLLKNKLNLEKESVSLLDIATEVVRQLRPLWKAKNQNIFLESVPAIPEVEGDMKALSTVVSNLVDNAIRYSPNNTEIFIRFAEHPGEVECIVQDQGCGISPEQQGKVFDEFYIVPSETEYARMDGRTGLGLFIAKGIVERHSGRIWVESTPQKGSTFHIVLPQKKEV